MALNVNNTALYRAQGIDPSSVGAISKEILGSAAHAQTQAQTQKKAQPQAQIQSIDYSKFNRASQGIDLYSSRTNLDLQRQIALTQAGLYVNSINVASLNSNAAANLYANTKIGVTQTIEDNNEIAQNSFNPFKKDGEKA